MKKPKTVASVARRHGIKLPPEVPRKVLKVRIIYSSNMKNMGEFYNNAYGPIHLSKFMIKHGTKSDFRSILLHEVAHACVFLTGGGGDRSHGKQWQKWARLLGTFPRMRPIGRDISMKLKRAYWRIR